MEIHEYQNKRIFKSYNLPVLKGRVAYTPEEAQQIATEIGGTSWQVKAQIYDPNRATGNFVDASEDKRGGVQIATSPEEVREITESMLTHLFLSPTMNYAGQVVNRVYIEETVGFKTGVKDKMDFFFGPTYFFHNVDDFRNVSLAGFKSGIEVSLRSLVLRTSRASALWTLSASYWGAYNFDSKSYDHLLQLALVYKGSLKSDK